MFNGQCLLTVAFCLFGASIAYKSYKNYKVYSVYAHDETDLNFLQSIALNFSGIDFWDRIHHVTNTSYRVMVQPDVNKEFVKLLDINKIENAVIIDDVQTVVEEERIVKSKQRAGNYHNQNKRDFSYFWNYDDVKSYLAFLAANFPKCKVSSLGKSEESREIQRIIITGDRLTNNPQTIIIDATIHAREWITTMMAVYIIYELVENRQNNSNLLQNINWIIVPILNPDGYVYSHEHDRFWRKTRTRLKNTNCIGIDANRNFNYHWDSKGGSSKNPCDEDYEGPKPSATAEVRRLSKFLTYNRNTKLYLTLHSFGQNILYPYGYTTEPIENDKDHLLLGKLVQKAIMKFSKRNPTKYNVGSVAQLLYVASGTSLDYAVGVGKIPFSFAFELPGGGKYGFDIHRSKIYSVLCETFEGIKVFGRYFAHKTY